MIDNKKIEESAKYYAKENSISIEDQMGDIYDGIEDVSDAEELTRDLMTLLVSFSGKYYGRRSLERRKQNKAKQNE